MLYLDSIFQKFETALSDYYDAIHERMADRCSPVDLAFYRTRAESAVSHISNMWIKFQCSDVEVLRKKSKEMSDEARTLMDRALEFERRSLKRAAV